MEEKLYVPWRRGGKGSICTSWWRDNDNFHSYYTYSNWWTRDQLLKRRNRRGRRMIHVVSYFSYKWLKLKANFNNCKNTRDNSVTLNILHTPVENHFQIWSCLDNRCYYYGMYIPLSDAKHWFDLIWLIFFKNSFWDKIREFFFPTTFFFLIKKKFQKKIFSQTKFFSDKILS